MNRVQKKQGANPFIQIFTLPAERIQLAAFLQQLWQREPGASTLEGSVAHLRRFSRDDTGQVGHIQNGTSSSSWPLPILPRLGLDFNLGFLNWAFVAARLGSHHG